MKTLKFLLAGAIALMAFTGCEKDESKDNLDSGYSESYYANHASISSSDNYFTTTDKGGALISFGASGGEVVVNVDCGTEWTAQNSAEDIFGCTAQSKRVTITAKQNLSGEELSGIITFMTVENHIEFATINVTQVANAYITLSPEELSLPNIGGTVSVTVESNYDWTYSYDSSNDWFTVERNEKDCSLSITYSKNETGGDQEGVVTITAGDGDKNVAEAKLKIIQSWENLDALIIEYTITDNNIKIQLPIYDVVTATIDWDDGITETTSTNNPSHTYATPGIYTITINGEVKRLRSNGENNGAKYLTAVKQWGNMGLTSMANAFEYCENLSSIPAETGNTFANVTTFKNAFATCESLESVPADLFAKSLNAENFSGCFSDCAVLTVPEYLFSKCVSATDFSGCFEYCYKLVSAPSFEGLNSITTFKYCFYNTRLTSLPENMFAGCSSVTDFSYCFLLSKNLTAVPENIFSECSAVTNFSEVFSNCTALKTIPVSIFDDSFLVTDFSLAFYNCSSLEGESPYTEMEINGEKVKVHLYERGDYAVDMRWAKPSGSYCFHNCTDLTDYSKIPSGWK